MITIQFTEVEFENVLVSSTTFRVMVAKQLAAAQAEVAKLQSPFAKENALVADITAQVKANVRFDNKISWIKNVRQWTVDNKTSLSPATYERFYGLANAKRFVEDIMGLPRYS